VSFAIALGGGTLRDLFLDRTSLFCIGNPCYPVTVFVIAVFSGLILRHVGRIRPLLLFPDALGMVLFRLGAVKWNWCLPPVREPRRPVDPPMT
jgi:uncharacterized membrane protein YeiH